MFNERALRGLFDIMNQNVPSNRRTLSNLLNDERPGYEGRNGTFFPIKRCELEILADLLSEDEWGKLRIPILLMTDISYGDGYWKIIGKTEVKVISKLINREPEKDDEMRIFYPYLNDIRKKLPTATSTLFSY